MLEPKNKGQYILSKKLDVSVLLSPLKRSPSTLITDIMEATTYSFLTRQTRLYT